MVMDYAQARARWSATSREDFAWERVEPTTERPSVYIAKRHGVPHHRQHRN